MFDWKLIIKTNVGGGELTAEDAKLFERFIGEFVNSVDGEGLRKRGCNTDFIAYLFLRYGFAYRDDRFEKDIETAEKAISMLPESADNLIGVNKEEKLKQLKKLKSGIGRKFRSPGVRTQQSKHINSRGRYKDWQIHEFIHHIDEYFRKTFGKKKPNHKAVLKILEYYPPWVRSKRGAYKKNDETEYESRIRLQKYIKGKPESFLQDYWLRVSEFIWFKSYWELPIDIRKSEIDTFQKEIREQVAKNQKDLFYLF